MPRETRILKLYQVGQVTIVGFGNEDVLDNVNVADCRDEIIGLIREHGTEVFAFDLTGVKLIPSGLLGLLASLRELKVRVDIINPSEDIREVLEITHLDQIMNIREVER